MTAPPPPLLSWIPQNIDVIDKNSDYVVSLDDVDLDVGPFTPFIDNGLRVRLSGIRLFYLMKSKQNNEVVDRENTVTKRRSMKNVCFKDINDKDDVIKVLNQKLRMPDCMARFMNEFTVRPRGKRFRKRFIFNSYIANVLTCTKCNKQCVLNAMSIMYQHDNKCVQEFDNILFKNNTLYLPPNCVNMKTKDKLCYKLGTCKGKNPVCNF
jgi:hypothetical protein